MPGRVDASLKPQTMLGKGSGNLEQSENLLQQCQSAGSPDAKYIAKTIRCQSAGSPDAKYIAKTIRPHSSQQAFLVRIGEADEADKAHSMTGSCSTLPGFGSLKE